MPCPYFEPQRVTPQPTWQSARLPLIDEYDGLCRATEEPCLPPSEQRFRYCNHGNALGECPRFPAGSAPSSIRFSITGRTLTALRILILEERDNWPVSWTAVAFSAPDQSLDPPVSDLCKRAQLVAFCQSYLKRFPA